MSNTILEDPDFSAVLGRSIKRLQMLLFSYSGIFLNVFFPFLLTPNQLHWCLYCSDRQEKWKYCIQHFKFCPMWVFFFLIWINKHSIYNPSGLLEFFMWDTKHCHYPHNSTGNCNHGIFYFKICWSTCSHRHLGDAEWGGVQPQIILTSRTVHGESNNPFFNREVGHVNTVK